jgi:hypothetical protein
LITQGNALLRAGNDDRALNSGEAAIAWEETSADMAFSYLTFLDIHIIARIPAFSTITSRTV